MKQSPMKTVAAIGIGTALFFLLGRFVAIPSPVPGTNICLQYGLLGFMSILYGPPAGALIGLIGHFLIDLSWGYGIWWSWVLCSAVFGFLTGLSGRWIPLAEGDFNGRETVVFNLVQAVVHGICWVGIAPVLDIFLYAEPANKVFLQGLAGSAANIVTTAIVGTLFCLAYTTAKPRKRSRKEE